MKALSVVFRILAVILSDVMCAVVAYRYCDMVWGIRCAGYSAPASCFRCMVLRQEENRNKLRVADPRRARRIGPREICAPLWQTPEK